MKLNSKYFDSIRVTPAKQKKQPVREKHPPCQWKGCQNPAPHRAPMGRGRDGQYFAFCMDHVRQYNATYNYFDGMSDDAVADFQKQAIHGHRPTWKIGSGDRIAGGTNAGAAKSGFVGADGAMDPHGLFGRSQQQQERSKEPSRRPVKKLELKALVALDLDATANRDDIKSRFKQLVKRHHPDGNGGDRGSEEKLREIIQAYNYLKQSGMV